MLRGGKSWRQSGMAPEEMKDIKRMKLYWKRKELKEENVLAYR